MLVKNHMISFTSNKHFELAGTGQKEVAALGRKWLSLERYLPCHLWDVFQWAGCIRW
jgi:hypothetical protein